MKPSTQFTVQTDVDARDVYLIVDGLTAAEERTYLEMKSQR